MATYEILVQLLQFLTGRNLDHESDESRHGTIEPEDHAVESLDGLLSETGKK
jgi:hypothetical protein